MAALTGNKFQCFLEDLAEKVHNLGADTLKIALSNVAPVAASDHEFADITEISAGNGYTAGGETVTVSTSSQLGGVYLLVTTGTVAWNPTGSFGPFRYLILYNDSATNKELISYYDHGSSITLGSGDNYTVDVGTTLLQLS